MAQKMVRIVHPKTKGEATVPESTYRHGLKAKGWKLAPAKKKDA